ncbi:MAG: serine hydrolase [Chloroflexi bacterium]|nr:serine hydrolase [Chloroflexota bacterium]
MTDVRYSRKLGIVCCALLCVALVFAGTPASAQNTDAETLARIDAHVERVMAMLDIRGVAVGIVQGDTVVHLKGYGRADEDGRAMTPQTPVVLASISKSFTGLAIQQLVEAGQLEIGTPVADILDWFPYPDIRVSHLLYQTGGFTTISGTSYLAGGRRDDGALEDTMRRVVVDYPPVREPGVQFEYSNTNYDLLGLIVQVVSGQPYEAYVQANIFTPLGMTSSYTSLEAAQAGGLSQGYTPVFDQMRPVDSVYSRGHIASAGLISSAEDMTRYHIALLNGGQYGDATVLSAEGVTALHTPGHMTDLWNGYGMGWWRYPFWAGVEDRGVYTVEYPYVLEHTGTANNYISYQYLVPARQLGIVVLVNSYDPTHESLYYNLPNGIAELLIGYAEAAALPAREDFLTQNGLVVMRVLLAIWVVMALLALRKIVLWWRDSSAKPRSALRRLAAIAIPALLDVGVLVLVLVILPPSADSTIDSILAYLPETPILLYGLIGLAAGWGAIRTLLYVALLVLNRQPQPVANIASR